MRRNSDLRLKNRSTWRIPTTTGTILEILATLEVIDIDGTGRLPEFASRLLFHVPSSSIRGSPGSFADFFILGDFVGYMRVFRGLFLFLYLYVGIIHPRSPPSHSRAILVSFNIFPAADRALLGKFHSLGSLFGVLEV